MKTPFANGCAKKSARAHEHITGQGALHRDDVLRRGVRVSKRLNNSMLKAD
jgi:hypothetical protein